MTPSRCASVFAFVSLLSAAPVAVAQTPRVDFFGRGEGPDFWGRAVGNWKLEYQDKQGRTAGTGEFSFQPGPRAGGGARAAGILLEAGKAEYRTLWCQEATFDGTNVYLGCWPYGPPGHIQMRLSEDGNTLRGVWGQNKEEAEGLIRLRRPAPVIESVEVLGEEWGLDWTKIRQEWAKKGALPRVRVRLRGNDLPSWIDTYSSPVIRASIDDPEYRLVPEHDELSIDARRVRWKKGVMEFPLELRPGAKPGRKVITVNGASKAFDLKYDNYTASAASTTRIPRAQLELEGRATARKAELARIRSANATLLRRKEEAEISARDGASRAELALQSALALQASRDAVERQERELVTFLGRVRAPEGENDRVRALKQAITSVTRQISRLEATIAAERRSRRDVSRLEAQLRQEWSTLKRLERDLHAQLGSSESGRRWLAQLRRLQESILELQRREMGVTTEQERAEAQLRSALATRADVDTRLFELAERLATLNWAVRGITVQAGAATVFQAVGGVPFGRLVDVNDRIAESEAVIQRLDQKRQAVREQFFPAMREANAAQGRLAERLYQLAYGRFAVDLGFHTYDVLNAMSKGGFVGAGTELAKKVVEVYGLPLVETSEVTPGSIEESINLVYQAELRDAWSQPALARVAAERGIKDLGLKRLTSAVDRSLGALVFEKFELPHRVSAIDKAVQAARDPRDFQRAVDRISGLQSKVDGLRKGYSYEVKDLLKGVLKDGLKLIVKGYFDSIEEEAWLDFIQKDVIARSYYPVYQIATHFYWEAFDNHTALLDEKATLLTGLDKETGLRTVTTQPFLRTAPLRITVELGGDSEYWQNLEVVVGGVPATRVRATPVFQVSVQNARYAADGTISLVLR